VKLRDKNQRLLETLAPFWLSAARSDSGMDTPMLPYCQLVTKGA